MMTARSILPPGKSAGACSNKKTPPTATFMPSVFITKASNNDTSLTRPVAFLRKIPRPSCIGRLEVSAIMTRPPLAPESVSEVTHEVHPATSAPMAFQSESESIRSVDDPGKLNRAVARIERHALHQQGLRACGDPEQFRLRRVAAGDLDDALGPRQVDPVGLGKDGVQRLPLALGTDQIRDN